MNAYSSLFANVVVGGIKTITLDAVADIHAYLPDTGAQVALAANHTNPVINVSSVANELVMVKLNVIAAGIDGWDNAIGDTGQTFGDLTYLGINPYFGLTVNQCVINADLVLGDITSTAGELLDAENTLSDINNNYIAFGDAGNLFCPFGS